jgi:hypothetical protein
MSYLYDIILFNFIHCKIYLLKSLTPVTTTNMKDILKKALSAGPVSALELLYDHYSGMLFSYILQFVPDRTMAGTQLVKIFSLLGPRLPAAFDSQLSVYCWLQIEARKIILEYTSQNVNEGQGVDGSRGGNCSLRADEQPGVDGSLRIDGSSGIDGRRSAGGYFALLAEAPSEHQWVFRELFINGRQKEELALQSGKDLAYISCTLRECLFIIRKNLGSI